MTVPRVVAVLFVLLLVPVPTAGAQESPATPQWWGPTGPLEGHHIRIPVTVSNPGDSGYVMQEPPVMLELDLSRILADAGWTFIERGDKPALSSFRFDPESVRVVAMTNLLPPSSGTLDGRLRVVDEDAQGDDRFVVASRTVLGRLTSDFNNGFHPEANPVITVFWHADRDIQPGEALYYMVYLDTLTHGDHTPFQPHVADEVALDTLYGPGPSREFYGFMPVGQGSGVINIMALHQNTQVTLTTRTGNAAFQPVPSSDQQPNPFQVNPGEAVSRVVARSAPVEFKLTADKPILAFGNPRSFVPGQHGVYADDSFRFFAPNNRNINFINAGEQGPTQIQVTDASGAQTTLRLDQEGQNPYSYSRACGSRPGLFTGYAAGEITAQVVQGGPILVQVEDVPAAATMIQVPDVWGRHVGSRFHANLLPTDGSDIANCGGVVQGAREWYVATTEPGVGVEVFNQDTGGIRLVPADPSKDFRPVASFPDIEGPLRMSYDDADARGHPLDFVSTGGQVHLFIGGGDDGDTLSNGDGRASMQLPVGPWMGGNMSTSFIATAPSVIINPYPDNAIKAEVSHTGGMVTETYLMGPDETVLLEGDPELGPLLLFTLESKKPVFVYPSATRPSYLAGMPAFPPSGAIEVGTAQFRGHLIALDVPGGIEPVVKSATPDEVVTYTLSVQNRGRLVGGGIQQDSVDIRLDMDVPDGWIVDWSPKSLPLFDDRPREVKVFITPEEGAKPGDVGAVTVEAVSKGNDNVVADVELITRVKSSFAVGIWFGIEESGPKFLPQTIEPGEVASFDVRVMNLGTVEDTLLLDAAPGTGGWRSVLLDESGNTVDRLQMEPREVRSLNLTMTPPDKDEDLIDTLVKVTSQSKPAAFDTVTARTKLREPTEVSLDTEYQVDLVPPGGEAVFPVIVSNVGNSGTEVEFDLLSVAKGGWGNHPVLFTINPADGTRQFPDGELTIGAGDVVELFVALEVPDESAAGDIADIRFAMNKAESQDELEAFFAVVVANQHDLVVSIPSLPRTVNSLPSNQTMRMTVANDGNLDELIEPGVHHAPPGWEVFLTGVPMFIPQGQSQAAEFTVNVPPGAPVGEYTVTVALRSDDGNVTLVPMTFIVEEVTSIDIVVPSSTVEAQPGENRTIGVMVTNTGNTLVRVTATPGAGDTWAEPMETAMQLQPLDQGVIMTEWNVPDNARDGASTHSVSVYAQNLESTSGSAKQEGTLRFEVGRPDIRVVSAATREAPGGTLVDAIIENDGDRTARQVDIDLIAGGQVVDTITIEELPSGRDAPVSLLAPLGAGGPYKISIDSIDAIDELDEGNNVMVVDATGDEHVAPTPSAAVVFAALALFVTVVRRRKA